MKIQPMIAAIGWINCFTKPCLISALAFLRRHGVQKLLPCVGVIHVILRAYLSRYVVVAYDVLPVKAVGIAQPADELGEGLRCLLRELAGLVRVAALNGEGVEIPLI